MNLLPVQNFILVEIQPEASKESGYSVPESVQEKPIKGTVVAGRGFDPGDVIVFRRYKGLEIKEKGKDYVFVELKDIVGYYG